MCHVVFHIKIQNGILIGVMSTRLAIYAGHTDFNPHVQTLIRQNEFQMFFNNGIGIGLVLYFFGIAAEYSGPMAIHFGVFDFFHK